MAQTSGTVGNLAFSLCFCVGRGAQETLTRETPAQNNRFPEVPEVSGAPENSGFLRFLWFPRFVRFLRCLRFLGSLRFPRYLGFLRFRRFSGLLRIKRFTRFLRFQKILSFSGVPEVFLGVLSCYTGVCCVSCAIRGM